MARVLCMDEYLDKEPSKAPERQQAPPAQQQQGQPSQTAQSLSLGAEDAAHLKNKNRKMSAKTADASFGRVPSCGGGGGGGHRDGIDGVPSSEPTCVDRSPIHNQVLEADIKEIRRLLKSYIGRLENKDTQAKNAKEWRLVARVFDRLFFFSYIATIVVSLTTAFPRDISTLDDH